MELLLHLVRGQPLCGALLGPLFCPSNLYICPSAKFTSWLLWLYNKPENQIEWFLSPDLFLQHCLSCRSPFGVHVWKGRGNVWLKCPKRRGRGKLPLAVQGAVSTRPHEHGLLSFFSNLCLSDNWKIKSHSYFKFYFFGCLWIQAGSQGSQILGIKIW